MVAKLSTTQMRMVEAGEELLGERGYGHVTMIDVIDRAKAPRGSIYYHFPGGKEELAIKVVDKVASETVRMVDRIAERTHSPEEFLIRLIERHRTRLENCDFTHGCPLVGIIANASTQSESLRAAAARAFSDWITAVTHGLSTKGLRPQEARRAASVFVAGVEGTVIMSRTMRCSTPFSLLADSVRVLLAQSCPACD